MKTKRVTREDLERTLRDLANVLGLEVGHDKGHISLDKVPGQNLYRIVHIITDTRAEAFLFNSLAYKPKELQDMMYFAMRIVEIDREGLDTSRYWPANKVTVN